ncbi:DUF2239 family protein [Brevundimonas variabilis]|uniref:DUF2239 domain-containing protein n=1 Tax=Brevundimonas variabilis TaxID=74312 RepID=A0A7W9FEM9_9CAUL|nr:DUF2239 family protein [Brevundimonas variabilis]MBB5744509.1 hypothetical protein [Brevundimonas variabilis]
MSTFTAFLNHRQVASGPRERIAEYVLRLSPREQGSVLIFADETGRVTDFDFSSPESGAPRGVGRPKLGVQAREVTLLPRHWEWLGQQSGGASASLRRLVDEARAKGRTLRDRQDAAYRFMQALCGDMAGYEEALRAVYRSDASGLSTHMQDWPEDVQAYVLGLLAERSPASEGLTCQ